MPPLRPRSSETPRSSEALGWMDAYGRYASFGLQLVVTMCLLGWGGRWLDGRLGTYPLLMVLGLFAGAGGSFYALIKTLEVEPDRRRPPADPR